MLKQDPPGRPAALRSPKLGIRDVGPRHDRSRRQATYLPSLHRIWSPLAPRAASGRSLVPARSVGTIKNPSPVGLREMTCPDYAEKSKEDLLLLLEERDDAIRGLKKSKRYGLVWDRDRTKEVFDRESRGRHPVLREISSRSVGRGGGCEVPGSVQHTDRGR